MPLSVNKKKTITQIAEVLFYAGVIIETLLVVIDKSAWINPFEGRLFQLTFLLFFAKVCLTKYTKAEFLTIFLFGILGVTSYFITDRNEALRMIMLVAACKNIDIKKCLKLVFAITAAGCAVIVICAITGLYGTMSLTQDYGRGSIETRYTLGMGHPNALQCMVWALTTLGLFLYGAKMKYYGYLLLLIVNGFFFQLTDSKTSLLVIVLIIALAFLCNERSHAMVQKIGALLGVIMTAGSILISVFLGVTVYRLHDYYWVGDRSLIARLLFKLNNFLNGRLYILVETKGYQGASQSWSLFSGPDKNYFFDMGWIRLFYWFGIIPSCIFVFATIILVIYCYRKKYYSAVIMTASFASYSVIEAHAFSDYLGRNYVFFLMGVYWTGCLAKLLTRNRKEISDYEGGAQS